jgi:hypothetical protein
VNTWSKTKLLGAAIVVGSFLLGTGYICLSTAGPPYPDVLWFFYRVGGVVIYGASMVFLGVLAPRWELRERRDVIWTGEWLGIISSVLLLSTAWLKFALATGLGSQLYMRLLVMWLLAHCLVQCILSVTAVALLVAKLFTQFRPGLRGRPPRTAAVGYFVCALTGPIVYSQFVCELFGP